MDSQVIKAVYLSSEGRVGRLAFFVFGLILGVINAVIAMVLTSLLGEIGGIISLVVSLGVLYLHYNLAAKRFHDLNKPSQYAIYMIIVAVVASVVARIGSLQVVTMVLGLVLLAVSLYLLFMPGTTGANDYGAVPETFPGGAKGGAA